jgi:hypothetical protein
MIRRWIRAGRLRSVRVGTWQVVDETDLGARTASDLELPAAWAEDDDGDRQPEWERLVRDGRSSH